MFDFSSGELLLIAVAALVFIKPKDLPAVLRAVGQWTGKIRRMAGEFQDQFREAMREAEMADLKKDIDEATSKVGGLDPFSDLKEAAEWKPPEPTPETTTPPAADAPPAPPAEAVMADTAPATAEAAPPAPHIDAPQPEAPKPDVMQGDVAPAAPGGDRAA